MPDCGRRRKLHKKEGGYALLIVMLALILISMFAVTFYTTSASHRLQQQQVESSTLSVGAAEMGVQRVHYELKNRILTAYGNTTDETQIDIHHLKEKMKEYALRGQKVTALCNGNLQEWADCEADMINERMKRQFIENVRNSLATYFIADNRAFSVDSDVEYRISDHMLHLDKKEGEIKVEYSIVGKEEEKEKELKGVLSLRIPEFISSDDNDREGVITGRVDPDKSNEAIFYPTTFTFEQARACPSNPGDLNEIHCFWTEKGKYEGDTSLFENWLSLVPEIKKDKVKVISDDICGAFSHNGNNCNNNWDFGGLSVYARIGSEKYANVNNPVNGALYVNGVVNAGNMNNADNFMLVARGIDVGNINGSINRLTLVLLGTGEPNALNWDSLALKGNSRACINISGAEDEINNKSITIDSGSLLTFYSETIEPKTLQGGKERYTNDYGEFLNACGLKGVRGAENYTIKGMNEGQLDLQTDVIY
ncbi:hypothetical protein C772_01041 [Bhargavaea cecembensis DSE10]|uniref:Tfp pilus assembly protein PilX n=1 Tax=Bhargavaea cecembensis DSE10 TaxID=1235279 RepID=M7NZ18_9BACL|nr:hypothetical protein [Bhargavaea cecembensis]EMR06905.1 hypothetical protein C772_01041 [Bhargavaea cecembensis DSE10]